MTNAIPTFGGPNISLPGTGISPASVSASLSSPSSGTDGSKGWSSIDIWKVAGTTLWEEEAYLRPWKLRRSSEWPPVKQIMKDVANNRRHIIGKSKWVPLTPSANRLLSDLHGNWLSEAESSTTPRTQLLSTHSIYLYRQFCFYAFGETITPWFGAIGSTFLPGSLEYGKPSRLVPILLVTKGHLVLPRR